MRLPWNRQKITITIDNTNRSNLLRLLSWAQYEKGHYLDGMPRGLDDALWTRVTPDISQQELMASVFTEKGVDIRYQRRKGGDVLTVHMDGLNTTLTGPRYLIRLLFPKWERHVQLMEHDLEEMRRLREITDDFKKWPLDGWTADSTPEIYADKLLLLSPQGVKGLTLSSVKAANFDVPENNEADQFTRHLKRNHTLHLLKSGLNNIFVANFHPSQEGCLYFIRNNVYESRLYVILHLDLIPDGKKVLWQLSQAALWAPTPYHFETGMGWKTLDPRSAEAPNTDAFQDLILSALIDSNKELSGKGAVVPTRGSRLVTLRPDASVEPKE